MTPPLPAAASITAAMTGTDAGVIRAIHARRPAAAHRLVQWDPEGAPAHLAPQDPPVPWGHRVM